MQTSHLPGRGTVKQPEQIGQFCCNKFQYSSSCSLSGYKKKNCLESLRCRNTCCAHISTKIRPFYPLCTSRLSSIQECGFPSCWSLTFQWWVISSSAFLTPVSFECLGNRAEFLLPSAASPVFSNVDFF